MQTYVISGTACFQGNQIFGVDGSEGEGDPGHRQEGMTILDDIGAFDYPMLDSVVDTTLRHWDPKFIFLFGSVASDKAKFGSDIDVHWSWKSMESQPVVEWKYSVIWIWTHPLILMCIEEEMSFRRCCENILRIA